MFMNAYLVYMHFSIVANLPWDMLVTHGQAYTEYGLSCRVSHPYRQWSGVHYLSQQNKFFTYRTVYIERPVQCHLSLRQMIA